MRKLTVVLILTSSLSAPAMGAESGAVAQLLSNYRAEGAGPFDAARGEVLWARAGEYKRSCSSCHGEKLTKPGQHMRTHKRIEPLAPSANPERLTDAAKVKKWLFRNCKWTYGRECSAQEKGDFLTFISHQ